MWLLVSWAHCSSAVKSSLADSDHLHDWLKKLTLLVPEVPHQSTVLKYFFYFIDLQLVQDPTVGALCCLQPAVRHEACNGLYKLSLSGLEGGDSINRSFLLLAASTLLKFLPDAQALKPLRVGLLRHSCNNSSSLMPSI